MSTPQTQLFLAEADDLLTQIPDGSTKLIFTDPPQDTGILRRAANGDPLYSYPDAWVDDDWEMMIRALFVQAQRILTPDGTLCIYAGKRVHDVAYWGKRYLDYVGEVIAQNELGQVNKKAWPQKHSTILLFAKSKARQFFDARFLPEEERRGVHDKSWGEKRKQTSVLRATAPGNHKDRTGYPDQKPLWLVKAFVECYTKAGDLVVDPFAGSGTTGAACQALKDRYCIVGDREEGAVRVMRLRLDTDPQEI